MSVRHFIDIHDHDTAVLRGILNAAKARKVARADAPRGTVDVDEPLAGRVLAMIFEKPSTRTRVSFDVGMRQLGGETIILHGEEMQLGRGETVADTARVLSRYVDAIMIRTHAHDVVAELAHYASVPVINGLTDASHPCQIMADLQTIEEHRGDITGKKIAWIGDGNNVAASFVHAAGKLGFEIRVATPDALKLNGEVRDWAMRENVNLIETDDPVRAAAGADCVVADTWVSMGDDDATSRHNLLMPYQVTQELMGHAQDDALFMHCLPAHRGEEVTAEVIDGPQSVIFDEAENRLHAQKAILTWCLGADG